MEGERERVEAAIMLYLQQTSVEQAAISTKRCVETVRKLVPDCDVADRDLASRVAEIAIAHGINVSFDH